MPKGIIVHTLILNDRGEILIIQRSKNDDILPGSWDIPGGTLEDGENLVVGAIREVKEETGLDISDPELFFQKSNIDIKKNKQFITLVFHAITSNKNIVLNPEDHEAYKWIKPSEVGTLEVVSYLPDCLRTFEELMHLSRVDVVS